MAFTTPTSATLNKDTVTRDFVIDAKLEKDTLYVYFVP